jgi:polyisoprenoid-binding protein YceI
MANRLPSIPLILSLLFAGVAHGDASLAGTPKVSFHAEGSPGALDIEGNTTDLRVADDGTALTFTVPLDSVTTGIKLRDHHMQADYAQTNLFPNATLTLDRTAITWPSDVGQSANGVADGTFTVHGVALPAQVSYVAKRTKTGTRLTGEFDFDVSRHGIEIPSYLGVTVDPKMHAKATIDLLGVP